MGRKLTSSKRSEDDNTRYRLAKHGVKRGASDRVEATHVSRGLTVDRPGLVVYYQQDAEAMSARVTRCRKALTIQQQRKADLRRM
jgi:hypothetical protein